MAEVVKVRDVTEEHIAGATDAVYSKLRRTLPQYIDGPTQSFGEDTYERMLTDPDVAAAFDILKDAVLADGVNLVCAVECPEDTETADPEEVKAHERSEELRQFVQRNLDGMAVPILEIADELLDGLAYGHKVAEVVMKPGDGDDAGRLVVSAIKPRPRQNLAFVVDNFNNTLGVMVKTGDGIHSVSTAPAMLTLTEELGALPNFVPIDQLLVFRWRAKNGDPRGSSILRPAYNPWYIKTQVYPDYYKFLRQFASPSLIGKTPEVGTGFVPQVNADGTPILGTDNVPSVVSATSALLTTLLTFLNSTAMVVPGGTDVELLFSQGDGKAFLDANDYFGRQISLAILKSTRLNQEAQHGSKADSATAQDVSGTRIKRIRQALQECLNQLSRWLVSLNYGPDDVKLAPQFSLAGQEAHDWVSELGAISTAYASGFIHDSQIPQLDKRLGLPERDMEAMAREKAEVDHQAELRAGDLSKVMDPEAA